MSALPPFCTRNRFLGRGIDTTARTFPARSTELGRLPNLQTGALDYADYQPPNGGIEGSRDSTVARADPAADGHATAAVSDRAPTLTITIVCALGSFLTAFGPRPDR